MYRDQHHPRNARPRRVEFADGSAVVTYPDGSKVILESTLAKSTVLSEGPSIRYRNRRRASAGVK
jgi:hypothetical protein